MAVIRKSYAGHANMPCFLLKWRFVKFRWSASFPPTQALRFPGQAGTFPYTCVENNRDCKGANVCLQPIVNPALQTKPRAILLGMYARLSNSEYDERNWIFSIKLDPKEHHNWHTHQEDLLKTQSPSKPCKVRFEKVQAKLREQVASEVDCVDAKRRAVDVKTWLSRN